MGALKPLLTSPCQERNALPVPLIRGKQGVAFCPASCVNPTWVLHVSSSFEPLTSSFDTSIATDNRASKIIFHTYSVLNATLFFSSISKSQNTKGACFFIIRNISKQISLISQCALSTHRTSNMCRSSRKLAEITISEVVALGKI